MKSPVLVFGTFDTPLARAQTAELIDRIGTELPRIACETILTDPSPLDAMRRDDPFLAWHRLHTAELAAMVGRGECRAIVAQAYDLPTPLPRNVRIVCAPDRSTPFDALLNRQGLIMDELEAGSRVGVLCQRAKSQLQDHWSDLEFRVLPGGVDHAMEVHLRLGEIDGLVLPAAVTESLGIQGIVSEIFSPEFILPAPGQGGLVILGATGDEELVGLLAPLHSEPTSLELAAELEFRRHMVSDLDLPIGVLARIHGASICVTGATGCGTNRVSVHGTIEEAEAAGSGLAQQLLCSAESFADLLEAEFPQGVPDDDDDPESDAEEEEKDYLEQLIRDETGAEEPDPEG